MSCCGQKRSALLQGRTGEPTGHAAPQIASLAVPAQRAGARPGPSGPGDVMLRYLGVGSFSTRSVRTGRGYTCAGTGASVAVDARDAESLLRTQQFTRL